MIGNLISVRNIEEAGTPDRHGGLGSLLPCRVRGRGIEQDAAAAAKYERPSRDWPAKGASTLNGADG